MGNILIQNTQMENQSKIVKIVAENVTRLMRQSLALRTVAAVATKAGMGTGTVDRIKKGQLPTSIDKIEQLADAFGVTCAALMSKNGVSEDADQYHQETREIIRIMQNTDNRGREKILSKAKDEILLHDAFLRMTAMQVRDQVSGIGRINNSSSEDQRPYGDGLQPPESPK